MVKKIDGLLKEEKKLRLRIWKDFSSYKAFWPRILEIRKEIDQERQKNREN